MTDQQPDLWERLRREVANGEQRLAVAVQHAQAEQVAPECFIADECVNNPRCSTCKRYGWFA